MNKTNGHYHVYTPCRPTDLVWSEICVMFVIYLDKEVFKYTKFCDYTIMGVAKGALGPWSPYLIFILCHQPFCQLCKKVTLRLSEHGDVIIETQTGCFGYLSVICHFGSFRNSVWVCQFCKALYRTRRRGYPWAGDHLPYDGPDLASADVAALW